MVRKLFFYLKNILKLVFAYFKIDPFIIYFHLNPIWNALKKIKFTQKVKFTKNLNLIISRIEDEKKNYSTTRVFLIKKSEEITIVSKNERLKVFSFEFGRWMA